MSDSVAERRRREREKALRKYGERALLPGGEPEYDILDFAINEAVGMARYGEMIRNRFLGDPAIAQNLGPVLPRKIAAAHAAMVEFAEMVGTQLIEVRNDLQELGLDLGRTEDDVFAVKKEDA